MTAPKRKTWGRVDALSLKLRRYPAPRLAQAYENVTTLQTSFQRHACLSRLTLSSKLFSLAYNSSFSPCGPVGTVSCSLRSHSSLCQKFVAVSMFNPFLTSAIVLASFFWSRVKSSLQNVKAHNKSVDQSFKSLQCLQEFVFCERSGFLQPWLVRISDQNSWWSTSPSYCILSTTN